MTVQPQHNNFTRYLTFQNHAGQYKRLAVALLYVWLMSIGTRTVRDGLRNLVDRTDRRDLSIFQIGFRFMERSVINALSYRILLCSYR